MHTHLIPFLTPRPVLDQGFLRLIRVDGDDGSIVEAARVTTGKGRSEHDWGDLGHCKVCKMPKALAGGVLRDSEICIEGDRRLIRYMMRHKHVSPFAFAAITIHFRCPVYVFRQWVRHWSWPFQEYSMRYSEAVDAMQATEPGAWRSQSATNRQGSAGTIMDWPSNVELRQSPVGSGVEVHRVAHPGALDSAGLLWAPEERGEKDVTPGRYLTAREEDLHTLTREVYQERLEFGVAKEQARKDLPLSNYTDVYATVRVRDLLPFLALRLDQHAQAEIRAYAESLAEIVQAWIPLTWEAFVDYQRDAVTFSGPEMQVLRDWLAGGNTLDLMDLHSRLAAADSRRVSVRERNAFLAALGLK